MKTEVLNFIKSCIKRRRIFWTYHVNMRLKERFISRQAVLASLDSFEIIDEYPKYKYLPSYLIYAEHENQIIHIHIATDLKNDNITIITVYKPTLDKWKADFKTRKKL
jgi:hypothetical protein